MSEFLEILPYLIPVFLLYYGFVAWMLVDLYKEDTSVKGENKLIWLLIILLITPLGPIIYLIIGKETKLDVSDQDE